MCIILRMLRVDEIEEEEEVIDRSKLSFLDRQLFEHKREINREARGIEKSVVVRE